jgi:hypothetical protein
MWAACEWAMMLRNCFVREETHPAAPARTARLIIGSGVRSDWWRNGQAWIGPTLTPFGPVSVRVESTNDVAPARAAPAPSEVPTPNTGAAKPVRVVVEGGWRGTKPQLDVRVPGFAAQQRVAAATREEFNLLPAS